MNKQTGRICALSLASLLFCITAPTSLHAEEPITPDHVHQVRSEMSASFNDFLAETLADRLTVFYEPAYIAESVQTSLLESARRCSVTMQKYASDLQRMQERIENYTGRDWEELYGQTGLWRETFILQVQAQWYKSNADFYAASVLAEENRTDILRSIIEACKQNRPYWKHKAALLETKVLSLSPRIAESRRVMRKKLDELLEAEDISNIDRIQAALLRLSITQNAGPRQAQAMIQLMRQSALDEQTELWIQTALLSCKLARCSYLEEILQSEQMQSITGEVLLQAFTGRNQNHVFDRSYLSTLSKIEILTAVRHALKIGPKKYSQVLTQIATDSPYEHSCILYTAGKSLLGTDPHQAIRMWIDSASLAVLEDTQACRTPEQIAREAAAHILQLNEEQTDCDLLVDTLKCCMNYAYDKNSAPNTSIAFAQKLLSCEKYNPAIETLVHICTDNPERTVQTAELLREHLDGTNHPILQELEKIIFDKKQNPANNRTVIAAEILCILRYNNGTSSKYEKIISISSSLGDRASDRIKILTGLSLWKTEQDPAAYSYLSGVSEEMLNEYQTEILTMLSRTLEQPEHFAEQSRSEDFYQNLAQTADKIRNTDPELTQTPAFLLLWAETRLLSEPHDDKILNECRQVLESLKKQGLNRTLEWNRCEARLLHRQADYLQAARLWDQIAQSHKIPNKSQQSWYWWRAKYYQFLCWRDGRIASQSEIRHACDVLLAENEPIPDIWKRKLESIIQ